ELARRLDRLLQARALDDVEPEELFLRLGERAVENHRLLALPDGRGGRCGQKAYDRPEAALLRQRLLHDAQLCDGRVVLLLRPGDNDVLRIVAKDGVKHFWLPPEDESRGPGPTFFRRKGPRLSILALLARHEEWRPLVRTSTLSSLTSRCGGC